MITKYLLLVTYKPPIDGDLDNLIVKTAGRTSLWDGTDIDVGVKNSRRGVWLYFKRWDALERAADRILNLPDAYDRRIEVEGREG